MLKLATVFSGVGAIEEALRTLNVNSKIIFACDTGERYIDLSDDDLLRLNQESHLVRNKKVKDIYNQLKKPNYVKQTYRCNFHLEEEQWYEDIRFVDGNNHKHEVDLFVGGSPCQSFSVIGKRAGLDDTRGTLFYDFARLVKEIEPKVFIYENVVGLKTHDKGNTWKIIHEVFSELGYDYYDFVLNSKNFGLPQSRNRVFVVGFKKELNIKEFQLTNTYDPPLAHTYLEKNVPAKYYLGKKGFEFVTNPKYKNRARVNSDVIMCQKANQQFNWNGDFRFVPLEECSEEIISDPRIYKGHYGNELGAIRKLTPRECFSLMGFSHDYVLPADVNDMHLYRQAGNSIAVPVLREIVNQIMNRGIFDEKTD